MNKLIIAALLTLAPAFAHANSKTVELRCTAGSAQACEAKTLAELTNQGCGVDAKTIRCAVSAEDAKGLYCSANVESCADASSDGFTGTVCREGSLAKIQDKQLSATWAKGLFWIWVRNICKI